MPKGEWQDLIPNLCTNASNQSKEIQLASLQTISYVCEELEPEVLGDELKNNIILALTNNISTEAAHHESCLLAVKGMNFAIYYAAKNFGVAQERDFIMTKLFEGCKAPNADVREAAMQCLVIVAKEQYQHVQHYFQQLQQVTANAAEKDQEKVGAQGIEFWTGLAEEEQFKKERGE